MTIPDWLEATPLTNSQIAEHCGADPSQPTRWKHGKVPHGRALLKLIELSKKYRVDGQYITADDIPASKLGPKRKPAGRKAS